MGESSMQTHQPEFPNDVKKKKNGRQEAGILHYSRKKINNNKNAEI
jgi:hypothetical protein